MNLSCVCTKILHSLTRLELIRIWIEQFSYIWVRFFGQVKRNLDGHKLCQMCSPLLPSSEVWMLLDTHSFFLTKVGDNLTIWPCTSNLCRTYICHAERKILLKTHYGLWSYLLLPWLCEFGFGNLFRILQSTQLTSVQPKSLWHGWCSMLPLMISN